MLFLVCMEYHDWSSSLEYCNSVGGENNSLQMNIHSLILYGLDREIIPWLNTEGGELGGQVVN